MKGNDYYEGRSYVIIGTSPKGIPVERVVFGSTNWERPFDGIVTRSSACGVKNGPNITNGPRYKELDLNHYELIQSAEGYLALRELLGSLPAGEAFSQRQTILPAARKKTTPVRQQPTPAKRSEPPKDELEKLGEKVLERVLDRVLR